MTTHTRSMRLAAVVGLAASLTAAAATDRRAPAIGQPTLGNRPFDSSPLAQGRPNIVFAIADDWSAPHAGAYGDPTARTPNFDRIAREGARFTHAFTAAPSCTPSRAALLTGEVVRRRFP